MTGVAILFLVLSALIVWGGLIGSIVLLRRAGVPGLDESDPRPDPETG